jgi:hypothetical protein
VSRYRLDAPDGSGFATIDDTYGSGRWEVVDARPARADRYELNVVDAWCGAPAVLEGLWWKLADVDPIASGPALERHRNAADERIGAFEIARRRTPAGPTAVDRIEQPSPTLRDHKIVAEDGTTANEVFLVRRPGGDGTGKGKSVPEYIANLPPGQSISPIDAMLFADAMCDVLTSLHTPQVGKDGAEIVLLGGFPPDRLRIGTGDRWDVIGVDTGGCRTVKLATDGVEIDPPPVAATRWTPTERFGVEPASRSVDRFSLAAAVLQVLLMTGERDEHTLMWYQLDPSRVVVEGRRRLRDDLANRGYPATFVEAITDLLAHPDERPDDLGPLRRAIANGRNDHRLRRALVTQHRA